MRQRSWIVLSLVLMLSLVLAGCGSAITAEEIVAKVQETVENTQDAHAIVSVTANIQGTEIAAKAEMWEKAPNKVRAVVLEASQPELNGAIMTSDGQQGWLYHPSRDVVMTGPVEQIDTPLPQEMLLEMQEVIQRVLDASDVELVGEDTVAGRDAYQLTLSPQEGSEQEIFPGNGTATLWVDKEQWFVLKATYQADMIGQGEIVVESFELNPGLGEDLFTFDIPDGVEVVDIEAQQPEYLTLDEAAAQASFDLLVPAYTPQEATLIQVVRMQDTIVLGYDHAPGVSFSVVQGPQAMGQLPLGQTEEVTVRGLSATLVRNDANNFTSLQWTENGVVIRIVGAISPEDALQVAESLQ
jgi:outer membrane lipoprotein-sorting protein